MENENEHLIRLYQDLQQKAGRFNEIVHQTKEALAVRGANVSWLDKMVEECSATVYSKEIAEMIEDEDKEEEKRREVRKKQVSSR